MEAQEQVSQFEQDINAVVVDAEYATTATKAKSSTTIDKIRGALADILLEARSDSDNGATADELDDLESVINGNVPTHGHTFDDVAAVVTAVEEAEQYFAEKAAVAPVEEAPVEEEPFTKKVVRRSQSPPQAKREEVSPGRLQKRKAKVPAKKAAAKVLPVGLEVHIPWAKGKLEKLGVSEDVFWNGAKAISGFDPKAYSDDERAAARKAYLKQANWERFRKPYPGKKLNRAQELNYKVLEHLAEALATTAHGFGQYGDDAAFHYTSEVSKDGVSLVEESVVVTKEDYDRARLILANRIDIGLSLERSRSKKEPVERTADKEIRTVLTDAAVKWVGDEEFTTQFMDEDAADFKVWLSKKLKKPFKDTYLANGMLTKSNYTKLVHLALERGKDYTKESKKFLIEGNPKPVVSFDYTDALTDLNNSLSVFKYNRAGKKTFASADDTDTVLEAAINGGKTYIAEALLQPGIMVLTTITSYSKDLLPEPEGLVNFIRGTELNKAYIRETEAINEYFTLRKPHVDAAGKERTKAINKAKKAKLARAKKLAATSKPTGARRGRR